MELELRRGGRTARVETLGGELVSCRGEDGLEYIWGGDPAFWAGRNPLLFPVVGNVKDGKVSFGGRAYPMERHGFARRQEFRLTERGEKRLNEEAQRLKQQYQDYCMVMEKREEEER